MTTYPTNVSDSQWQVIATFLNNERKRKHNLREVTNAIFYLVKSGCHWRLLPHDFPYWKVVYYYFSTWKKTSIIERMHEALVEKTRVAAGKKEEPTVGIIDSQSVKNTLVSTESCGFDGGKKIKGVKRHIITDTMGLLLAVVIHSAGVQDRVGAVQVVEKLAESWKKIVKIFADGGYTGTWIDRVKERFQIGVEIVKRTEAHVFKVLPKRWIVERTFAWIETNRRNAKFYERLEDTGVAMVQLSAIRRMLKPL